MSREFVCTRCRLRSAGEHDCQDRACACCWGDSITSLIDSIAIDYQLLDQPFVVPKTGWYVFGDGQPPRELTDDEVRARGYKPHNP